LSSPNPTLTWYQLGSTPSRNPSRQGQSETLAATAGLSLPPAPIPYPPSLPRDADVTEAEFRSAVVFARRRISRRPVVFSLIRAVVASSSPDLLRPPGSWRRSLPTGPASSHAAGLDLLRFRLCSIGVDLPHQLCSSVFDLSLRLPSPSTSSAARCDFFSLLVFRLAQLLIYSTRRLAAPLQQPRCYSIGWHQPICLPWRPCYPSTLIPSPSRRPPLASLRPSCPHPSPPSRLRPPLPVSALLPSRSRRSRSRLPWQPRPPPSRDPPLLRPTSLLPSQPFRRVSPCRRR
jgi:hypothetical protein